MTYRDTTYLKILPLKELATFSKLLFMYDYINNKLPVSFRGIWRRRNELNKRNLRNSNMFDVKNQNSRALKDFLNIIFKIYGIKYVTLHL